MAIDRNAGSKQNDAISMVANQLHVDLSATIKPDLNKGAAQVGAAINETADKSANLNKIEQTLHQQLGDKSGGGTAGPQGGGLSRGIAIGMLGALGLGSPSLAQDPIRPAAPLQTPGVQVHAAEIVGGPTSFKPSSDKKGREDEPSVYQDAMGGMWNFKTGFEATNVPVQQAMTPQQTREMQAASRNAINTLGADAVREDLGQIGETKKRLGQQAQQALDDAERLGVGTDKAFAIKPFAPGGMRPNGMS